MSDGLFNSLQSPPFHTTTLSRRRPFAPLFAPLFCASLLFLSLITLPRTRRGIICCIVHRGMVPLVHRIVLLHCPLGGCCRPSRHCPSCHCPSRHCPSRHCPSR